MKRYVLDPPAQDKVRRMIDLRSDTVTRPTQGMRRAMAEAEVGDDVFGDDKTAETLEAEIAELLGKEAAIFMPSGTMANQIAIRVHCHPGDEILCEQDCHIYNYEQGAFAQLSGVVAAPIPGVCGALRVSDVGGRLRAENDHLVRTRLLCLENTHNRAGGAVLPIGETQAVCDWAHANGLSTHLDGARLFNAAIASNQTLSTLAAGFDTVSVCFSKGLGAPIGSALAGPKPLIRSARRHRKLFGGGMRQVGVLAAAALYSLRHHRDRLAQDHEHAQRLAKYLNSAEGLKVDAERVETNILFVQLRENLCPAQIYVDALASQGVAVLAESTQRIRLVTHMDVSRAQIDQAGRTMQSVAKQLIGTNVG